MGVQVNDLTKRFNGKDVVDHVSFQARENEILGFLGPNGAGKSTTMKIITCFLPPTHGTVQVNGLDVSSDPIKVKKITGYLPENNPLYPDMYIHEYLSFIAKLNGITGSQTKNRVEEMIEICGLLPEQNKLIGSLSKGYRQRVGLAQTLIHDPQVLILDEPTTGLDPNQITEVRNLIKEISKEKTVILSTHIMQEVKAICDKVVIINEGSIVADGSLAEIQDSISGRQKIRLRLSGSVDTGELTNIAEIEDVKSLDEEYCFLITARPGSDVRSPLNKLVVSKNVEVLELSIIQDSLEDIFRQLTNPVS